MIKNAYKKKGIQVTEIKDAKYIAERDAMAAASAEERAWAKVRNMRNDEWHKSEWLVQRHKEQLILVEAGLLDKTTLSHEQYLDVLAYRQELRDITKNFEKPRDAVMPDVPKGVK